MSGIEVFAILATLAGAAVVAGFAFWLSGRA
jgi:hypothetical protein